MNNFIFENATKVYFGKGALKEYLRQAVLPFGNSVLLAYGGGSIKKTACMIPLHGYLKTRESKSWSFRISCPIPHIKKCWKAKNS